MNPGELRHRITIESQTSTKNSYGEIIKTGSWETYRSTWAAIKPIDGKQFFAVETVNSELTHEIKFRYHSGITPDMRVKFGSRYFEVLTVINSNESNAELKLMCRELV